MQGETCYCPSVWQMMSHWYPKSPNQLHGSWLARLAKQGEQREEKAHFWNQEVTHPQADLVKCPWELCSFFRPFVLLVDQTDLCWLDLFILSHLSKKAKSFSTMCHTSTIVHHSSTTNSARKGLSSTLCGISIYINYSPMKNYYNIVEIESKYCYWDGSDQYWCTSLVLLTASEDKK